MSGEERKFKINSNTSVAIWEALSVYTKNIVWSVILGSIGVGQVYF